MNSEGTWMIVLYVVTCLGLVFMLWAKLNEGYPDERCHRCGRKRLGPDDVCRCYEYLDHW